MNNLTSIFAFNHTKNFLKWKKQQVNDDEKWDEKAVDYLVKKLKTKQGALSNLERALTEQNPATPCVLLTKSVDGRIQVLHRKIFPHLAYCKIWRWADLRSHNELKSLSSYCDKGYRSKSSEICVNPYHYQKIDTKLNLNQSDQFFSSDSSLSLQSSYESSVNKPTSFGSQMNSSNYSPLGSFCESPTSSMSYSPCSDISNYSNTQSDLANSFNSFSSNNYSLNNQVIGNFTSFNPCNENLENWCSVTYYEFNYPVSKKEINFLSTNVDGQAEFHDNTEFSLSQKKLVKETKKKIGQGIQLINQNGQIFIKRLSFNKIYIQSCFASYLNQDISDSVIELPSTRYIKIFDENKFQELVYANYNLGFEAVYSLHNFCKINISFTYGWGPNYSFIDLTSRPCWLEIIINRGLPYLDKPLTDLSSSRDLITSES